MKIYLTNNSLETVSVGEEFAKDLEAGDLVLLYGDLGAGKTIFVQGIAKGLGIKERVLSPTFVLVRSHEIPNYSSSKRSESRSSRRARTIKMNHIDLYRIGKQNDIISLGLDETIDEKDSVTIIEWADRLLDFKPAKSLPAGRQGYRIWLENIGEDKRKIIIQKLT